MGKERCTFIVMDLLDTDCSALEKKCLLTLASLRASWYRFSSTGNSPFVWGLHSGSSHVLAERMYACPAHFTFYLPASSLQGVALQVGSGTQLQLKTKLHFHPLHLVAWLLPAEILQEGAVWKGMYPVAADLPYNLQTMFPFILYT